MIVVHHLNNSRSQRIVWLLEELAIPYRIEQHRRDSKTNMAPPDLKGVHPLGKAPVVEDDGLVVAESGAIIEYLVERYGEGRLMPARGTREHVRYLEWMHFAEGTLMLHIVARMYLGRALDGPHPVRARVDGLVAGDIDFVERELGRSDYLAGAQFSAADVQMVFPLEFAAFYGLLDPYPRTRDYVTRAQARPAYRRAIEKGGPYAFEPKSAAAAAPFPKPAR